MFELNFNRSTNRQKAIAVLVVIGFVLLLIAWEMTGQSPEETEAIIAASKGLKEHDRFCMNIPQPYDFKLKFKTLGGNSFTTAISYSFWSDQPWDRLKSFYRQNLELDGWIMTGISEYGMPSPERRISFEKESYRVSFESAVTPYATNYALECAKIER